MNNKIAASALLRTFRGVVVATKTSNDEAESISQWISSYENKFSSDNLGQPRHKGELTEVNICPSDWCTLVDAEFPNNQDSRLLIRLTVAVAVVTESCRLVQGNKINGSDLEFVWSLIHDALTSPLLTRNLCTASRSAQGFLAVPLCSLIKDGHIEELFRLHVWLPDNQRVQKGFGIHSHQAFGQSWVLAGQGTDHSYSVEPVTETLLSTHAEYELSWSDGTNTDSNYKTHQTHSVVVNTGRLVRTTLIDTNTHARNMTYSVPAAAYHSSDVGPSSFHATLFFFDSHRGFEKNAGILGPKNGNSFMQIRDPADITPKTLANMVESARRRETCVLQERQCGKGNEAGKLSTIVPQLS